ncbi:MAG: hypothetical protein MJZ34_14005 [Paludibacteraceae bacterium]|nr:hypothetical protein [Paludibacteraceae bacterium]
MESKCNTKNYMLFRKLYTILIICLPVTSVYASPIPSVNIGELICAGCVFCLLLDMIKNRRLRIVWSPVLLYLGYAVIVSIMSIMVFSVISSSYSSKDVVERVIRDAYYFSLIAYFAPSYFDFEYGKKVIEALITILGIYVIVQFVVYEVFKVYIPGIIPQMKTTISGGVTGAELTEKFARNAQQDGFARPNGFLAEPAIIAQVVSVGLLLELFPHNAKTRYLRAGFYSLIMIITFSVNAYVVLFAIWSLWILFRKGRRPDAKRIILYMMVIIIGGVIIMQSNKMSSIIYRLEELITSGRTSGSSVVRVIRGPAFYANMPIAYQIIGIGFGNFIQFKEIYGIQTIYETVDEYLNTNAYILISSGLIGFTLYLMALVAESKKRIAFSSKLVVVLLIFGLSSSIYSSAGFVIMFSFLLAAPKEGG